MPKKTADTVTSILAAWAALKPSATKRASLECGLMFAKSIEIYFNRVLPYQLLYTFERQQFQHLVSEKDAQFSELYGMEHLLRLLVLIPDFIVQSSMDPNSYPFIVENINDLMEFINYRLSNSSDNKYEYSKASDEYVKSFLVENNLVDEKIDEFIPMGMPIEESSSNPSPDIKTESNEDINLHNSDMMQEVNNYA